MCFNSSAQKGKSPYNSSLKNTERCQSWTYHYVFSLSQLPFSVGFFFLVVVVGFFTIINPHYTSLLEWYRIHCPECFVLLNTLDTTLRSSINI